MRWNLDTGPELSDLYDWQEVFAWTPTPVDRHIVWLEFYEMRVLRDVCGHLEERRLKR